MHADRARGRPARARPNIISSCGHSAQEIAEGSDFIGRVTISVTITAIHLTLPNKLNCKWMSFLIVWTFLNSLLSLELMTYTLGNENPDINSDPPLIILFVAEECRSPPMHCGCSLSLSLDRRSEGGYLCLRTINVPTFTARGRDPSHSWCIGEWEQQITGLAINAKTHALHL